MNSLRKFISQNALKKFNLSFSKKIVLTGKPINLSSFSDYHLDSLFEKLGWKVFLEIKEKFYPNLVQTFYANLSLNDSKVINSRVGSVDVTLSIDDIALILALLNKGLDIFSKHLNSFQTYPEGEYCEPASLLIHNNSNQALTLNDKVSYLTSHVRF